MGNPLRCKTFWCSCQSNTEHGVNRQVKSLRRFGCKLDTNGFRFAQRIVCVKREGLCVWPCPVCDYHLW